MCLCVNIAASHAVRRKQKMRKAMRFVVSVLAFVAGSTLVKIAIAFLS